LSAEIENYFVSRNELDIVDGSTDANSEGASNMPASPNPNLRELIGQVERTERNSFTVVRETGGQERLGFLNNQTVTGGNATAVRPGMRFRMGVEDRPDVFVVRTLDLM
jgi:hypothetical protein